MHSSGIEHDDCVFADEVAIVCGVFRGEMGCAEPEWVMATLDLSQCQHASVARKVVNRVSTSLIRA